MERVSRNELVPDGTGVLERDGILTVAGVLDALEVARLRDALQELPRPAAHRRGEPVSGIRHLLRDCPAVREVAASERVRSLVVAVLGPAAMAVRALFFDKTPGANWKVPWHQDLVIAVRKRAAVPGYGGWSLKGGVLHVQPPAELLARMLTLRLHLDPSGPEDGSLQVFPGSHRRGRLLPEEIDGWRAAATPRVCLVEAGDAVLMRPLLLHASSPARRATHRRVLHLEWAAEPLPEGLDWTHA